VSWTGVCPSVSSHHLTQYMLGIAGLARALKNVKLCTGYCMGHTRQLSQITSTRSILQPNEKCRTNKALSRNYAKDPPRPVQREENAEKAVSKESQRIPPLNTSCETPPMPILNKSPRIGLSHFFEDRRALPMPPADTEIQEAYGRAWSTDELRVKSFGDLHGLWFVLLREMNMLSTQRAEATRLRLVWPFRERWSKCKLSMSRIKSVLAERLSLYQRAKEATAPKPLWSSSLAIGDATEAHQINDDRPIQPLIQSDLTKMTVSGPPIQCEGQMLAHWQKSEKMRQLWRKRAFRKTMNYRRCRDSRFV
jgi:hypothetical protein